MLHLDFGNAGHLHVQIPHVDPIVIDVAVRKSDGLRVSPDSDTAGYDHSGFGHQFTHLTDVFIQDFKGRGDQEGIVHGSANFDAGLGGSDGGQPHHLANPLARVRIVELVPPL
jgi:hypothetical protein